MLKIKTCTIDNPRCGHLNLCIFEGLFLRRSCWLYRLTLAGWVRWALPRSCHPLLSNKQHKIRRDVYPVVPQEQPSLMTGSMQRLITSLVSQTSSRRGKTLAKGAIHSITRVQHSLTSSDFFTQLGITDETVQLLRGLLQHSGVHWKKERSTSHSAAATSNAEDACYVQITPQRQWGLLGAESSGLSGDARNICCV